MATVSKFTRGAVSGNNSWTSPANAVSDDATYATCAPGKNGTVTGFWDFDAFLDAEIPVGSTINSVTVEAQYKVSTTKPPSTLALAVFRNGLQNNTLTDSSKPTADFNWDVAYVSSIPSEADLKTAGFLTAKVTGGRGNNNTAVTISLDYVKMTVDFTAPGPTYNESPSGGPTMSGSLAASSKVMGETVSGGLTMSGSKTDSFSATYNEPVSGGSSMAGSATDSKAVSEVVSGTLQITGSSSDQRVVSESVAGGDVISGSLSAESWSRVYNEVTSGPLAVTSGLSDVKVFTENVTSPDAMSGSLADEWLAAEVVDGSLVLSGSELDSLDHAGNYTETPQGGPSMSGTTLDTITVAEQVSGSLAFAGSTDDSRTVAEAVSGSLAMTGSCTNFYEAPGVTFNEEVTSGPLHYGLQSKEQFTDQTRRGVKRHSVHHCSYE